MGYNTSMNNQDVIKLARLAGQLADRFEKIGLGEDGKLDPDDKKLAESVRKQIDKVLTIRP